MDWFELVNSVGIVGALAVGAFQSRSAVIDARERDRDRRTERALDLYRDLVVEGDTASAFHRLSVRLRHIGSQRHGITTWNLLSDDDLDAGGILDPQAEGADTPFEDLYRVLWYFERVEMALDEGLVDRDVLLRTIGFHCWWWGELLRDVKAPKAAASLRKLAPDAFAWAETNGQGADWLARCSSDFGGSGARSVGREGQVPDESAQITHRS